MSMTIGSIGGIPMYLFGSIAAVGILLGLMLTRWTAWLYDESFPFAFDVALWGIPLGLIFGRIGHVLRFWEFFADDPVKIMYFWEGGFSPLIFRMMMRWQNMSSIRIVRRDLRVTNISSLWLFIRQGLWGLFSCLQLL